MHFVNSIPPFGAAEAARRSCDRVGCRLRFVSMLNLYCS